METFWCRDTRNLCRAPRSPLTRFRSHDNFWLKGLLRAFAGTPRMRGNSVRWRSGGFSSRALAWLGGAAAFLLGGLVTAAHELPVDGFHSGDLSAHLGEVHANTG